MKLVDLNPRWIDSPEYKEAYLQFDYPAQHNHRAPEDQGDARTGMRCVVVLPVEPQHTANQAPGWTATNRESIETITISSSIWHHCEKDPHFFIRNGEIVYA